MHTKPAHFQQKLGYGFILFGLLLIIGLYFAADGGAYVFSALLGLMAIVFGSFQLVLAKPSTTNSDKHSNKARNKKAQK